MEGIHQNLPLLLAIQEVHHSNVPPKCLLGMTINTSRQEEEMGTSCDLIHDVLVPIWTHMPDMGGHHMNGLGVAVGVLEDKHSQLDDVRWFDIFTILAQDLVHELWTSGTL